MENLLIWVNEEDEVVGYGEKIESHRIGQLHRAFSVFIYDQEQQVMLIQQRAQEKYHSGGLWSNACCSHPYKEESWEHAFCRAMSDELGIAPEGDQLILEAEDCDGREKRHNHVYPSGQFHYFVRYGELAEHEMDHVFVYYPEREILDQICPVPEEVQAIQWLSLEAIDQWLERAPEEFSNWFPKAYAHAKTMIQK